MKRETGNQGNSTLKRLNKMKSALNQHSFITIACIAFLFAGCDKPANSTDSKTEWVNPATLNQGPIQHEKLTEEQMVRVLRIQKVFSEVDPSPLEKWVEDFRRDVHPENEIRIWERMATAFEGFSTSRKLSLEAKKETFQVVLLRSSAPDGEVLAHLKLKTLTEKEAREIMAQFPGEPEPIRAVAQ